MRFDSPGNFAPERFHFSSQSGVSIFCRSDEDARQVAGVSAIVVSSFSPALRPRYVKAGREIAARRTELQQEFGDRNENR